MAKTMAPFHTIPFQISNDTDWLSFIVPVTNIAEFDLPRTMRVGQRLMNALGDRNPDMFETITNTDVDIWEIDDPHDPKIRMFFEKVFELFVEGL